MATYYTDFAAAITAQDSNGSDITAGNFSSGTQTTIQNDTSGNGKGAPVFACFLEVDGTNGPDTATAIEVHAVQANDSAKLPNTYRYKLTGEIATGEESNQVFIGWLVLPQYAELKWKPIDYNMDGKLIVVPQLGAS